MLEYKNNNEIAIIILHEIYGINKFIEEVCEDYHGAGFDVFCPAMLKREGFSYKDSLDAYDYFISEVGFAIYKEIEEQIERLKKSYKKVFVLGFSIGATIAWRCSENSVADGIICCYGSRIRDYLLVQPICPTLLLFAKYDSFNVSEVINRLQDKKNVEAFELEAHHGFLDKYNEGYNKQQSQVANDLIKEAIGRYSK